jgi:Intracellular proteinase inhibitor
MDMNRKWPTVMVSSIALAGLLFSSASVTHTEASSNIKSTSTVKMPFGIVAGEVEGKAKVKIMKNGNVKLNYKAKNQTENVVTYTFPSGLTVDYIVYDSEGKKFTQYSDQVLSTLAIEEMTLKQGEEYQENFIIKGLPNGKYTIDVFLNTKEDQAKTSKKFTVKNSIYNRTKGTLISWNDKANTVQIMLGEKPTTFQMTDFVKEQLMPIEKGQEMDFIYSDTKIELKTIEKIIVAPKKVTLKKSVLELDKELLAMYEHIKKNRNLTALEGYQPFEVFSTYIYT